MGESAFPLLEDPDRMEAELRNRGFALLAREATARLAGTQPALLDALQAFWDRLPPDQYRRDGGRYRFRRHSCWTLDTASGTLRAAPHRAHWQPLDYNALHGGLERWYEPIEPGLGGSAIWCALLTSLGSHFARLRPVPCWFIEAHQFRIDTREGIGRPTPEGAHRDGVDFVSVSVVSRQQVKGGETRVFESDGPRGLRFTMDTAWTTLILDDARMIHETTPIQPTGPQGHRDTLVLTFRADGFQEPR
jgi:hypothetical protein